MAPHPFGPTFADLDTCRGEMDQSFEEIRQAAVPHRLTVVSDDRRIREAARRRHCAVQGCGAFLDRLDAGRQPPSAPRRDDSGKPTGTSGDETQRWLREFADLEPPGSDEGALVLAARGSPGELVSAIISGLGLIAAGERPAEI